MEKNSQLHARKLQVRFASPLSSDRILQLAESVVKSDATNLKFRCTRIRGIRVINSTNRLIILMCHFVISCGKLKKRKKYTCDYTCVEDTWRMRLNTVTCKSFLYSDEQEKSQNLVILSNINYFRRASFAPQLIQMKNCQYFKFNCYNFVKKDHATIYLVSF